MGPLRDRVYEERIKAQQEVAAVKESRLEEAKQEDEFKVTCAAEFDVRTANSFSSCTVRSFDVRGDRARLVIAQP